MTPSFVCSVLLIGIGIFIGLSHGLGMSSDGFDYTFGTKATTDTLLAREVVFQTKSLLQGSTKTYTLTQAGTKTINYISITNLKRVRGATAEITSGGIGTSTLTVKFTAPRGSGIKSQIEVWGA